MPELLEPPKKIYKQDLYDYVDRKTNEKLGAVSKKRDSYIDEKAEEVLTIIYPNYKKFHSAFADLIAEFDKFKDWELNYLGGKWYSGIRHNVRDMRNSLNGKPFSDILKTRIKHSFSLNSLGEVLLVQDEFHEVKSIKNSMTKKLNAYQKERDNLTSLRSQLRAIIKNESTAKKAWKTLQGYGLDMNDLYKELNERDGVYVPATTELSVDINILNNG